MNDKELLELIRRHEIRDQHALMGMMKGGGMTQSTLSRRLKKLGVRKKHGVYVVPAGVGGGMMTGVLLRVTVAPPNLLILHSPPGHAHALAYQLDNVSVHGGEGGETGFPEILATLAGDDTVFVATLPENLMSLKEKIEKAGGLMLK